MADSGLYGKLSAGLNRAGGSTGTRRAGDLAVRADERQYGKRAEAQHQAESRHAAQLRKTEREAQRLRDQQAKLRARERELDQAAGRRGHEDAKRALELERQQLKMSGQKLAQQKQLGTLRARELQQTRAELDNTKRLLQDTRAIQAAGKLSEGARRVGSAARAAGGGRIGAAAAGAAGTVSDVLGTAAAAGATTLALTANPVLAAAATLITGIYKGVAAASEAVLKASDDTYKLAGTTIEAGGQIEETYEGSRKKLNQYRAAYQTSYYEAVARNKYYGADSKTTLNTMLSLIETFRPATTEATDSMAKMSTQMIAWSTSLHTPVAKLTEALDTMVLQFGTTPEAANQAMADIYAAISETDKRLGNSATSAARRVDVMSDAILKSAGRADLWSNNYKEVAKTMTAVVSMSNKMHLSTARQLKLAGGLTSMLTSTESTPALMAAKAGMAAEAAKMRAEGVTDEKGADAYLRKHYDDMDKGARETLAKKFKALVGRGEGAEAGYGEFKVFAEATAGTKKGKAGVLAQYRDMLTRTQGEDARDNVMKALAEQYGAGTISNIEANKMQEMILAKGKNSYESIEAVLAAAQAGRTKEQKKAGGPPGAPEGARSIAPATMGMSLAFDNATEAVTKMADQTLASTDALAKMQDMIVNFQSESQKKADQARKAANTGEGAGEVSLAVATKIAKKGLPTAGGRTTYKDTQGAKAKFLRMSGEDQRAAIADVTGLPSDDAANEALRGTLVQDYTRNLVTMAKLEAEKGAERMKPAAPPTPNALPAGGRTAGTGTGPSNGTAVIRPDGKIEASGTWVFESNANQVIDNRAAAASSNFVEVAPRQP